MSPRTPEVERLQEKAKAGDAMAAAHFAVLKWNTSAKIGAKVAYEKSSLEGRVTLKTTGEAYVLGAEPVVELEHIGTAMLQKIERQS